MNKKIISKICILLCISLFACQTNSSSRTMQLNGVDYPEIFVKSGFYFDKASMSDALLSSMLEKITTVDKPSNMGTVDLPDFSKITLENNKKEEIDNARIEAALEEERDLEVTYSPIKEKRDAKITDKVIIDFKGYVDGEELEGGDGKDYDLVLGSGQFIPGFEEQVAGHAAGKKFSINVTFPTDYNPTLAGKNARFDITIKSIEEAITPEIDEEFVKNHTKANSKTVEEYKEEVKNRLEEREEFLNKQNLVYQLTDYLFDNTKFYPTEEALAWQFSVMMNEYNRQAAQSGTTFENMVNASGVSIREAYDEIKSATAQAVQATMINDELLKRFPSEVTENDAIKWFEKISTSFGYGNDVSYEEYKNYMGYENIRDAVKQENALMQAVSKCNIVDYVEESDK